MLGYVLKIDGRRVTVYLQFSCVMVSEIPIEKKVMLTVAEAAAYSNLGSNCVYSLLKEPNCPFAFYVGKRKKLIKRKEFEEYLTRNFEIDVR